LPDTLHLSDGSVASVVPVIDATVDGPASPAHLEVHLSAAMPAGWGYVRVANPAAGTNCLLSKVLRADGSELRLGDNVWTTHRIIRLEGQPPQAEDLLHLFDGSGSSSYTLVYAPPPPPTVISAASTRRHGNGTTIPYVNYLLALNTSGTANATSEPRNGGPQQIDVTFDVLIASSPLPTVTASAGTPGAPQVNGNVLTIPLSGVPDKTCVTLTIDGITAATGSASGTQTVKVLALRGDVNNDHQVGITDIAQIKARSTLAPVDASTFRYDINCDGLVGATDLVQTKAGSALTVWPCTLP
jgi:hypothetical protein